MKISIYLVGVALIGVYGHVIKAQVVCPVNTGNSGACASTTKCQEYCQDKYGADVLGSECSMNGDDCKPTCVCKLKCQNGGASGDPHYWSFDGARFDYMGLKKHYLSKPCEKYNSLPNFEIRQTNRPYSGPISVLDSVELVVPEWERVIEVKIPPTPPATGDFVLTVNGVKRDFPYKYPVNGESCNGDWLKVYYKDAAKTMVIIETSFGVRIRASWPECSVDIPRHPELKVKSCGILGRPNDNQGDDCFLGTTGAKCTFEPGWANLGQLNNAFGDSWIVPGQAWSGQCFPPEEQKKHQDFIDQITPEAKQRVKQLCEDNINNPAVQDCAKKLGRPVPSVEACIFDAQFLPTADEQRRFVKALVRIFENSCDVKIPFKDQAECCPYNDLVPLFRNYHAGINGRYYTPSTHSVALWSKQPHNWQVEGSPGYVSTSPKVCGCDLKFVISMWGDHHFYTLDKAEADLWRPKGFKENDDGQWYCSQTSQCGATLALKRFYKADINRHLLTTNPKEAAALVGGGWKDEGVLCYIWPGRGDPKYAKMDIVGVKDGDYK